MDEVGQKTMAQDEIVHRSKAKFLAYQNKEIVVQNLKRQIQQSMADQQQEVAARTKQQEELALENRLSAGMLMETEIGSVREGMRSKCLYHCPNCKRILIDRAHNYAKLLKKCWDENATEKMLSGRERELIDQMISEREELIRQTIEKLWQMHADFESTATMLLKIFTSQTLQNELEAQDYNRTLIKLQNMKTLFATVKEEFEKTTNHESNFKEMHQMNKTQTKRLSKLLKMETEIKDSRETLVKSRDYAKWLESELADEKRLAKRLDMRRQKLEYHLNYVKESWKYCEEVRQNQTKEVQKKILPDIQEEKQLLQRRSENISQKLGRRHELLTSRKGQLAEAALKDAELNRNFKRSVVEKTLMEKQKEDNDMTTTQIESELRSTYNFLRAVMAEPEKNQAMIEKLSGLQKDSKKWLGKMDRICKKLYMTANKLNITSGKLRATNTMTRRKTFTLKNELQLMARFINSDQFFLRLKNLILVAFEDILLSEEEIDQLKEATSDAKSTTGRIRMTVLDTIQELRTASRGERSAKAPASTHNPPTSAESKVDSLTH